MVYFRVTEEEFVRLNEICQVSGARSISDLARQAVALLMESSPDRAGPCGNDVVGSIEEVERLMHGLQCKLKVLRTLLISGENGHGEGFAGPSKRRDDPIVQ